MSGLRIDVIAVGKLKEGYWVEACAEYAKRLSRYVTLNISEVPDRAERSSDDAALVLRTEAAQLRKRIASGSRIIMLDSGGRQFTSEQIAALLREAQDHATRQLSFVIGGSRGIDADLKKEADLLMSFGAITLPHNLARVVLLEQLYRAFSIITATPYHK
ncbi:MAG: 23S rRNA (pseudouridine(1915)-N(3))-methyltransferase RlmH [Coriobacteriales bacterium]|jgi:23S rRNA (pseudouridine1915-N3)-methyltransferase|nr:23S rRNA (pseudouridine(1915)-N(3))-methyltransferase RlmH [Coriobacteriales bacterium]